MSTIRVTCPTCKSELEIEAEYDGQEVECGNCLQVFVAKGPKSSRPSSSGGPKIPGASTDGSRGGRGSRDRRDDEEPERKPKRRPRRDDDDDDYEHDRRRDEYDDDDDGYYSPPPRRDSGGTGLATTALILGIVSIPMACCCGLFSLPLSLGATITGGMAMKSSDGKGMAIAGLILGVIGLGLSVLSVIANIGMMGMQNNQQFR